MRSVKFVYTMIKWSIFIYGIVQALLRSRWIAVGVALWKILQKRKVRPVKPTSSVVFINGSEPAIYRRAGMRRIRRRT